MFERLLRLPLLVILMGIGALWMYVPAAHAAALRDFDVMRVFFQSANLLLILTIMIGIATSGRKVKQQGRNYLLALLAAFALLPILLAVPVAIAVSDTTFFNAYVEMVSDFTTTGATLFSDPDRLPPSVHLWRAIVAWLGGLLMLVAAVAILAPMRLGGFEVLSSTAIGRGASERSQTAWSRDGSLRLWRSAGQIAPIYFGLTLILWIALLILGDPPLVAISHAMSVLSTSGVSPVGGLQGGGSGLWGEGLIFLLLVLAVSREAMLGGIWRFGQDPEFRLAMIIVVAVPLFLMAHHWAQTLETDVTPRLSDVLRAFWGGVFTTLSFLTTTGFESAAWSDARQWSGLGNPGIILMGLALIGGGVATTAGGVKLLRIYALYRHGTREMDRLVFPSSVGGAGSVARRLRRQGAFVAWIFFMLFGLSLALVILAFTLAGLGFEDAVTLAVAGLSTTGPIAVVAAENPLDLGNIGGVAKGILVGAMVLGRLETLAIVALLNPEFWRK